MGPSITRRDQATDRLRSSVDRMFTPQPAPQAAPPASAVSSMFMGPLDAYRGQGKNPNAAPQRGFGLPQAAPFMRGVGVGLLTGRNWAEGLGRGVELAGEFSEQADARRRQAEIDLENARERDLNMAQLKRKMDAADREELAQQQADEAYRNMLAPALDDDPTNDIPGLDKRTAMFMANLPVAQRAEAMAPFFMPVADKPTDDMREYRQAVDQGYKGTFLDYQTTLRQAGRSQNIVNMPGNPTPDEIGRKAFAEANAKSQADYFDKVATAGALAQQRLGDIDQLTKLIELTPQGAGQDYLNKGAAVLSRFGVDLGEYTNVPAAQAFQSIVSRIAPTLRVAGSGATSDFEMNQFLASLPAISNMPDGNRNIASNLKKISERSVQEANIAAQVQAGELTPADGRKKILALGALNLDLPSFSTTPPAGGPGGAPNVTGPSGVRYEDNLPEGFQ
jgi:hypothetical protein